VILKAKDSEIYVRFNEYKGVYDYIITFENKQEYKRVSVEIESEIKEKCKIDQRKKKSILVFQFEGIDGEVECIAFVKIGLSWVECTSLITIEDKNGENWEVYTAKDSLAIFFGVIGKESSEERIVPLTGHIGESIKFRYTEIRIVRRLMMMNSTVIGEIDRYGKPVLYSKNKELEEIHEGEVGNYINAKEVWRRTLV
jgi:hypothetical protein